jgi:hypothetical protein
MFNILVSFRERGDVINHAKFCVDRLNCFESTGVQSSGSSMQERRRALNNIDMNTLWRRHVVMITCSWDVQQRWSHLLSGGRDVRLSLQTIKRRNGCLFGPAADGLRSYADLCH